MPYMPVYKLIYSIIQCIYIDVMKCGSKRGPRGPKNQQIVVPFAMFMLFAVIVFHILFERKKMEVMK